MARVPLGVAQARGAVSAFRPDAVLATGGCVAAPTGGRRAARDVTGGRLREAVGPVLGEPGRREAMAAAARAHGRPDAAERLVDVILSAASR
ncbi:MULTISPECIES: hypothetical protein [Streptomyces]|uniref:hypothetical protein n=1 Tax=Streptomyces TaxID=1883 RepID=UPI00215D0BC4|nr:hypothetical protein [Streptomyces sp. OUCMDZ-4982]MCR8941935.1 hypothetical protein [Streptomyces sp. OUCMDZ-4982]